MSGGDEAILETAALAARRAGRALLQAASGEIEVEREMPGDIKLAMDRRAEELIVGTILGRFPDHRVLSEECGRAGGSGEVEWVIDPLDGTSNYSRRFPCWCTCVAASRHGEPFVGVVYDPTREEMFTARRGCGACLNGLPLRVSGRRVLGESILAYGIYHHAEWSVRAWERRMPVVTPLARSTRNVGSAGLHMAYVAAGRVDAFIEYGVFPWDVAAGIVLVREAGGRVSSWNVEEGALDIVAAAPGVYDALMATGLWPAPA